MNQMRNLMEHHDIGDSYVEASAYFKLRLESVKEAAVQEVAKMYGRNYGGACNALCHE